MTGVGVIRFKRHDAGGRYANVRLTGWICVRDFSSKDPPYEAITLDPCKDSAIYFGIGLDPDRSDRHLLSYDFRPNALDNQEFLQPKEYISSLTFLMGKHVWRKNNKARWAWGAQLVRITKCDERRTKTFGAEINTRRKAQKRQQLPASLFLKLCLTMLKAMEPANPNVTIRRWHTRPAFQRAFAPPCCTICYFWLLVLWMCCDKILEQPTGKQQIKNIQTRRHDTQTRTCAKQSGRTESFYRPNWRLRTREKLLMSFPVGCDHGRLPCLTSKHSRALLPEFTSHETTNHVKVFVWPSWEDLSDPENIKGKRRKKYNNSFQSSMHLREVNKFCASTGHSCCALKQLCSSFSENCDFGASQTKSPIDSV